MKSVWEERRAGRFRVSFETIKELPDHLVGLLFGSFLIVRAEHCIMDGCVHYEGVCRLFEPVEEGRLIPWYKVRLERTRIGEGVDDDYRLVVERDEYQDRDFPR